MIVEAVDPTTNVQTSINILISFFHPLQEQNSSFSFVKLKAIFFIKYLNKEVLYEQRFTFINFVSVVVATHKR